MAKNNKSTNKNKHNINTDGRKRGDYKTRYKKPEVKRQQKTEAVYLVLLLLLALIVLFLNAMPSYWAWLNLDKNKYVLFTRLVTCSICGLIGGIVNDIKWFYHTIARGYWNEDRCYWRVFSPIVSLFFAFSLACILHKSMLEGGNHFTSATLGFLSGYFSDKAAGKMSEVANVLFNTRPREYSEKNNNDDNDNEE